MTAPSASPRPPLVIGIGTEHRRDDRCGLDVVRGLRPRVGDRLRIQEASADVAELLDLWTGEALVRVVDGVRSGALPGTRRTIELTGDLAAPGAATSTHGLSLTEAIGLGRALGRIPTRLTLHTIEIEDVSVGDGLTPAVAASVAALVEELAVLALDSSTGRDLGGRDVGHA